MMEQLLNTLNEQPCVTVFEVKADNFLDYGVMLDTFYKPFDSGTVQKNHMFWVNSSGLTTMYSMEFRDSHDINSKDFHKGRIDMQCTNNLYMHRLEAIQAPGLKEIKMVELYTKWHPFVPDPYKDMI